MGIFTFYTLKLCCLTNLVAELEKRRMMKSISVIPLTLHSKLNSALRSSRSGERRYIQGNTISLSFSTWPPVHTKGHKRNLGMIGTRYTTMSSAESAALVSLKMHILERKNHDLYKNSYFEVELSNFHKIHILKISFLTKFTFLKSYFRQNSDSQSHIFHKIHIFRISYLTKFTFL